MLALRNEDYYAVLGLEMTATRAEVKKAYRDLAKYHHPDKKTFGAVQDMDGRRVSLAFDFRLIQTAWETLSDDEKRAEYDVHIIQLRQDHAKMEKQQAKERARQQKKKRAEELAQIRAYKKEEELVAKEAAIRHLAEMKAEEMFLEKLYLDKSGEDDTMAIELQNLKAKIEHTMANDPELEDLRRESDPVLRCQDPRLTICNDPELDEQTNATAGYQGWSSGAQWNEDGSPLDAEDTSADPELDDPAPMRSPSTLHLMAEIDRAINERLSDPRLSDPRLSMVGDPRLSGSLEQLCGDPEI